MNRKGFTLIEMMIVVAIIAVLVAIALPNMLGSRRAANEKAALGELRTVATAMETYFIREDEYPTTNPFQTLYNEQLLPSHYNTAGTSVSLPSRHYTFTVQTLTSDSYNIEAKPDDERYGRKCYAATTGGELWEAPFSGSACGTYERI